jgi:hypothetical protein
MALEDRILGFIEIDSIAWNQVISRVHSSPAMVRAYHMQPAYSTVNRFSNLHSINSHWMRSLKSKACKTIQTLRINKS